MKIHLLNPTEFSSIISENVALNLFSRKIYGLYLFEFSKKWTNVTENIFFTEFYTYYMKALMVYDVCKGT